MGIPQFILALTKEQAAVFSNNLGLFLVVGAIVAGFVWWLRGKFESSRAEGLKAQLEARNERLSLAEEQQRSATQSLERQVGELRMQITSKAPPSVLEATSSSIETSVTALSTANTALHEALQPARSRGSVIYRFEDED